MVSQKNHFVIQRSELPVSPEVAWNHAVKESTRWRTLPPFWFATIHKMELPVQTGSQIEYEISEGKLKGLWHADIKQLRPGYLICEHAAHPQFSEWIHWKQFLPANTKNECIVEDRVEYKLKNGSFSNQVDQAIREALLYQQKVIHDDLELFNRLPAEPKRILLAGGSGLVGTSLKRFLESTGHEVSILSRSSSSGNRIWNPDNGELPLEHLENQDIIINLTGETVAQRWTKKSKQRIWESRVKTTELLVEKIQQLEKQPEAFIQFSGTGYYGYYNYENLDESSARGTGFLAELCQEWENATDPLKDTACKCIILRLGAVITPEGGALAKVLPIFKTGLGGPIGSGKQGMPWISINDLLHVVYHSIFKLKEDSVLNVCSPDHVNNRIYSKFIGKAIGKPSLFPVPPFMLSLLYNDMAKEILIGGAHVMPKALEASGFHFKDEYISNALRSLLGTTSRNK